MKKKGFTLIELLAVIVILAIIALIATPAVLNIIEDSRRSAAEASARNIANAAKTYYMKSTMNNNSIDKIDLSDGTLKYNGEQAKKGKVFFDNEGNVFLKLYINGYCVERNYNGVITTNKVEESECEIPEVTPESNLEKKIGDVVYYNPTLNDYCTDYVEANSNEDNFSGCLKWYIYDIENDGYELYLDHGMSVSYLALYEFPEELLTNAENMDVLIDYVMKNEHNWSIISKTGTIDEIISKTKFYENLSDKENAFEAYYIVVLDAIYDLLDTADNKPIILGYGNINYNNNTFDELKVFANQFKEKYPELLVPEFLYKDINNFCDKTEGCMYANYLLNEQDEHNFAYVITNFGVIAAMKTNDSISNSFTNLIIKVSK